MFAKFFAKRQQPTSPLGRLYSDGEIIVKQGDSADCMFVILEGKVEVVLQKDGGETLLRMAQQGELIGEMALFQHTVRSATVRASGPARLLSVDQSNLYRRIDEDPSLALRLLGSMSKRILELSEEIGRLKSAADNP